MRRKFFSASLAMMRSQKERRSVELLVLGVVLFGDHYEMNFREVTARKQRSLV